MTEETLLTASGPEGLLLMAHSEDWTVGGYSDGVMVIASDQGAIAIRCDDVGKFGHFVNVFAGRLMEKME